MSGCGSVQCIAIARGWAEKLSESYTYDLLCIGSGPAGQRAAIQAAKLGKRVAIVEKRPMVGGVCVDTGTIPSKTFREAAISFSGARSDGSRGRRPEVRPTAEQLLARVDKVVQSEGAVVEEQIWRNGVVVI